MSKEISKLQARKQRESQYLSTLSSDVSRIDSCLGALALSASSLYAYDPFCFPSYNNSDLSFFQPHRTQTTFRNFFTKQLNAAKDEQAKVEKVISDLNKQIDDQRKKKDTLVKSVKFSKTIDVKPS